MKTKQEITLIYVVLENVLCPCLCVLCVICLYVCIFLSVLCLWQVVFIHVVNCRLCCCNFFYSFGYLLFWICGCCFEWVFVCVSVLWSGGWRRGSGA